MVLVNWLSIQENINYIYAQNQFQIGSIQMQKAKVENFDKRA